MIDSSEVWTSFAPTRIAFGPGAIDAVGRLAGDLGSVACLVTGRSAQRLGSRARCEAALVDAGLKVLGYPSTIGSDPTVEEADLLAAFLRSNGIEVVVALGGGSVIDCAKAAAMVSVEGGTAEEHLQGLHGTPRSSLPVVAIPTTAGTGAESSRGAILFSPRLGLKAGLRGEALMPRAAIVDPCLTLSLPPTQTRYTGFDAFAHAVETYVSRRATPVTALFSQRAVRGIARSLPRVLAAPDRLEDRTEMALCASLMGYNLANASTCLPHRLQYAVGAATRTAHGLGLAAIFPAWVRITESASPERFRDVARWMAEGMDIDERDVSSTLEEFMARIDLRPELSDLGVSPDDVPVLVGSLTGSLDADPWWRPDADPGVILSASLGAPTP